MLKFENKSELRKAIESSQYFYICFECGLNFFSRNQNTSSDGFERNHKSRFMFFEYESQEKFISAIWRKIKSDSKLSELKYF